MTRFSSQALDELLGTGISQLDITAAERSLAVARYTGGRPVAGRALGHRPPRRAGLPPGIDAAGHCHPQHTTITIEIDIDLVARRDQPKESISQADLKADAGIGLEKFVLSEPEGSPTLDEGKRCWTLHYAGFHLDVLPALPNPDANSEPAIIITDTELVRWQFSNPIAYANWFHKVMAEGARGQAQGPGQAHGHRPGAGLAGQDHAAADSPGAQAAPRHLLHRRARPPARLDHHHHARRPRLPRGRRPVRGARRHHRPDAELRQHDGQRYIVANPVEPKENFADRWHSKPERPRRSSGGSSRPRPTSTTWPASAAASTR